MYPCLLAAAVAAGPEPGAANGHGWRREVLANEYITVELAPHAGGRVIQFSLGDYPFFYVNRALYGKAVPPSGLAHDGSWLDFGGDKLWPAPQGWDSEAQWPGPPDPVLDGGAYTCTVRGDAAIMASGSSATCGVRFSRVVRLLGPHSTRVGIAATMTNVDTRPRRWSVWSVTQLDAANRHGGGHNPGYGASCAANPVSRFPRGYDVMFGLVNNPTFKRDAGHGLVTVDYQHRVGKIGVDSPGGWVASVDRTDGCCFVQRYAFHPDQSYPDGTSVQFWSNGEGEFFAWGRINTGSPDPAENPCVLESELLSPFAELAPGEAYTFCYEWAAARVVPGLRVLDCNAFGVTTAPLRAARMADGLLCAEGSFGVLGAGTVRPVFLDAHGNRLEAEAVALPVTPLAPFVVDQGFPGEAGIPVPAGAETLRLLFTGLDGSEGVLAEAALGQA